MIASNRRPIVNRYKVPAAQWLSFSNQARRAYNIVFHAMRPSRQGEYARLPMTRADWNVLRARAAYTAACATDGIRIVRLPGR